MKSNFWSNKKILVTGGHGFLGTHLVQRLQKLEPQQLVFPPSGEVDFRDPSACRDYVRDKDIVIHAAADVGGIGENLKHPGRIFYNNMLMNLHLVHESQRAGVKKFVGIGSVCAYPNFTPVPFREEDWWNGPLDETNAAYGHAKKMLFVQSEAYRREFGFNAIYLLPVNYYGPGDNFDPASSHVVAALIRKIVEAKRDNHTTVTVWGSGNASREFVYITDVADAIIAAAEKYNKPEPINIGSGQEITIKELAYLIAELTGYRGNIVWDATKPDGTPRRKLDVSKAEKEFGFVAQTDFRTGLTKTINYFKKRYLQT